MLHDGFHLSRGEGDGDRRLGRGQRRPSVSRDRRLFVRRVEHDLPTQEKEAHDVLDGVWIEALTL